MKIILKTLSLLIINNLCFSQISIFGVDITKHLPKSEPFEMQKAKCIPNAYFSFANYKWFGKTNVVVFENYNVTNKTLQMKDGNKYVPELKTKIEKQFGQPLEIFVDAAKTIKPTNYFIWVFQYNDKYYEMLVHVDRFFKSPALLVQIHSSAESLKESVYQMLNETSQDKPEEYVYSTDILKDIKIYSAKK